MTCVIIFKVKKNSLLLKYMFQAIISIKKKS